VVRLRVLWLYASEAVSTVLLDPFSGRFRIRLVIYSYWGSIFKVHCCAPTFRSVRLSAKSGSFAEKMRASNCC